MVSVVANWSICAVNRSDRDVLESEPLHVGEADAGIHGECWLTRGVFGRVILEIVMRELGVGRATV